MSEILTNVAISKVYPGKSGENDYGKWWAYNFYVKDHDEKFSYFKKEDGVEPVQGMEIQLLEYEIGQRGEYTNYDVKRFTLQTTPQATPQTAPEPLQSTQKGKRDSSITMFISYAKDLMVSLMPSHAGYNQMDLEDLGKIATSVGLQMYDQVNSVPETVTTAPKSDEPPTGEPPHEN